MTADEPLGRPGRNVGIDEQQNEDEGGEGFGH